MAGVDDRLSGDGQLVESALRPSALLLAARR
jgi:hypothetical protein